MSAKSQQKKVEEAVLDIENEEMNEIREMEGIGEELLNGFKKIHRQIESLSSTTSEIVSEVERIERRLKQVEGELDQLQDLYQRYFEEGSISLQELEKNYRSIRKSIGGEEEELIQRMKEVQQKIGTVEDQLQVMSEVIEQEESYEIDFMEKLKGFDTVLAKMDRIEMELE